MDYSNSKSAPALLRQHYEACAEDPDSPAKLDSDGDAISSLNLSWHPLAACFLAGKARSPSRHGVRVYAVFYSVMLWRGVVVCVKATMALRKRQKRKASEFFSR